MPLPLSFAGRVEVAGQHDLEDAAQRLERGLSVLKAKRIHRTGPMIQFAAGGLLRMVSNTNVLVPISAGKLLIELNLRGLVVVYYIRFTQMLLFSFVLVFGFVGPVLLSAPNLSSAKAVGLLLGLWVWLFGGNVISTLIRFPRWIRRTVDAAGN